MGGFRVGFSDKMQSPVIELDVHGLTKEQAVGKIENERGGESGHYRTGDPGVLRRTISMGKKRMEQKPEFMPPANRENEL
ncbi:MAG: hypothetical protein LUE23_04855 [Lachnospiraceae bacterium]|nr:hypothetical protein [Lachnospiraceae bacterium]